jgi:hypothetical protein
MWEDIGDGSEMWIMVEPVAEILFGIRQSLTRCYGCNIGAMCTSFFHHIKHHLGSWSPSHCQLQMANRVVIYSQATWKGTIELGNIQAEGEFEVFDSDGVGAFYSENHSYGHLEQSKTMKQILSPS